MLGGAVRARSTLALLLLLANQRCHVALGTTSWPAVNTVLASTGWSDQRAMPADA
jgi:hypothetical protein